MAEQTTPLLERAVSIHEQASMPWPEAEALALSEFGVFPDDIVELVGECTSSRVLIEDEITAFAISVLVHGSPLLAPTPPAPQAMPDDRMVQALGTMLAREHAVYLSRESVRKMLQAVTESAPQAMPPVTLPEPAFRLKWKDGAYYVSEPNISDTDCYTREQVIAAIADDRKLRGGE